MRVNHLFFSLLLVSLTPGYSDDYTALEETEFKENILAVEESPSLQEEVLQTPMAIIEIGFSDNEIAKAEKTVKVISQAPTTPTQPPPESFQLFVDDKGFFLEAEFLYWKTSEGTSLEYAFTKNFPVYNDGTQIADGLAGDVNKAHFDWAPGARVGLGYQFAHDSFELFGQYTYYHTHGSDNTKLPSNLSPGQANQDAIKNVFPTNYTAAPSVTAGIKSHISLNYQEAALKLEKHLNLSKYFSLGVVGAIEGAWMHQHWKVDSSSVVGQTASSKSTWKYWGIGPGLGFDCDWYFVKQFSLFIDIAGSLLMGHHNSSLKTVCSSGVVNDLFQKIHPTNFRIVPHMQLSLGVEWNHRWPKKRRFLKLFAAYELNTLFNVHEVYRYHDIGVLGSQVLADALYSVANDILQMQGINVGAGFHF